MWTRTIVTAALVALLTGCASNEADVDQAFVDAQTFTFYTVDPDPRKAARHRTEGADEAEVETLRDWVVLGKVEVTDKADRRMLLAAMQRGIDESDGSVALCFNPRHAMRIGDGTDSIEYIICFECLQVQTHYSVGGQKTDRTSDTPANEFNAFATKKGLPIAD